jgi:hypothetical protein
MNYTQEELSDPKFLKSQIKKYTERIKNAKKKVSDLQECKKVYQGILKNDPFYIKYYRDLAESRINAENPCRICGREVFSYEPTCFDCQRKALRKDRAVYYFNLTCMECGEIIQPKSLGIPFKIGDRGKCHCGHEFILTAEHIKEQIKYKEETYNLPKVTKVGE